MARTISASSETATVVRHTDSIKQAKIFRDAAVTLQADQVILRATGTWISRAEQKVSLDKVAAPVRDLKTAWVEASVNGSWVWLRPHPGEPGEDRPSRLEIEARFAQ